MAISDLADVNYFCCASCGFVWTVDKKNDASTQDTTTPKPTGSDPGK